MRDKISSARQWTGNGLSALGRGAAREAKSCFARASDELPNDPRILANLARAHYQQGEYPQAVSVMSQAVELAGGAADLQVELGNYLLATGQPEKARQLAASAIKSNHRSASAWLLSGRSRSASRDWSGALSDYQRALGIEHEREDIQMEVVEAYRQLNQPLRALSAVEQILQRHPVDRQPEVAILAKSDALVELKQLDPAIEILEIASRRKDVSGTLWTKLADAQVRAGRLDQARTTLAKAQEKYPGDATITNFVSELGSQTPRVAFADGTTPK